MVDDKYRILFVDDDPNILAGYQRSLRKYFDIDTANGGATGLLKIEEEATYAVIVSDFKMPNMNGAEFLNEVKKASPDSVRVLLTGQADFNDVIDCVNKGGIYKFLTKPCDSDAMSAALRDCIRQFDLIQVEKTLLEDTLRGSIAVLLDVLALANPSTFGYTTRIQRYVEKMVAVLALPEPWQYSVAAMLAHVGYITLDQDLVQKVFSSEELSAAEQQQVNALSELTADLLDKIPRLENVTEMIRLQGAALSELAATAEVPIIDAGAEEIGAQLLRTAIDYDRLITAGKEKAVVLNALSQQPEVYHNDILRALDNVVAKQKQEFKLVTIDQLGTNMTLAEDVMTADNVLLVSKGQDVTRAVIARLQNFAERGIINTQVKVSLRF